MNFRITPLLGAGLLALNACSDAPVDISGKADKQEINELREQIQQLNQKVLESNTPIELKLGNDGYSPMKADIGMLTFQLDKLQSEGAGTKVSLTLGNTTSATITTLSLYGFALKPNGESGGQSLDGKRVKTNCSPGTWCAISFIIDDIKPNEVSSLTITSASATSITLAKP